MPDISVGEWQFAYDDAGSGPPVVLLHGLLMDRTMWEHHVAALEDAYRVVTVDAPGHGGSPPRAPGFSAWDEAEALGLLADALEIGPAVWGGQSMGGFKSLRLALSQPERVRGLILIDTSAGPENAVMLPQYEAFLEVAKSDGISEDLVNVVGMVLFGEGFLATPAGKPWRDKLVNEDAGRIEGTARLVFDRDDVTGRLAEIAAPTLVIHGAEDVAIAPDVGRETAAALGARYLEVAGAGHGCPVERPEEAASAIRAFLDEIHS